SLLPSPLSATLFQQPAKDPALRARARELANPRAANPRGLEIELQRELHRPIVNRGRGDPARRRRIEVLVREAEARMVEQVEGVPAELDVRAADHGETLRQRGIEIDVTGPVENAAAAVAVGVRRRRREV